MRYGTEFQSAASGAVARAAPVGIYELLAISNSVAKLEELVTKLSTPASANFRVTTSNGLESAVELLKKGYFAAVLYDNNCNTVSCWEHLHALRAVAPDTAILVLCNGEEDSQAQRDALSCGAQECILPSDCTPKGLGRLVRNAIERQAYGRSDHGRSASAGITLDSIGDAILSIGVDGRVSYLNRVAEIMTGWRREDAVGQPPALVFHIVDELTRQPVPDPLTRAMRGEVGVGLPANCLLMRKDGCEYLVEDSVAAIRRADGQACGAVIVFRDVGRQRASARHFAHLAQHDGLTNLPNRRLFGERLENAIVLAQRHGRQFALLYLDLDGFKRINDSCGHGVGDQLLRSVADRLVHGVRASDTVCRHGGDEFVVLLSEVDGAENAAASAATILRILSAPHSFAGQELCITASIGISVYPHDGHDATSLVGGADSAMLRAKRGGRNRLGFASAT